MEDGGVDRTVIDCRQNQLGQMADFNLPIAKIIIVKNEQACVTMVSYLKKGMKVKI